MVYNLYISRTTKSGKRKKTPNKKLILALDQKVKQSYSNIHQGLYKGAASSLYKKNRHLSARKLHTSVQQWTDHFHLHLLSLKSVEKLHISVMGVLIYFSFSIWDGIMSWSRPWSLSRDCPGVQKRLSWRKLALMEPLCPKYKGDKLLANGCWCCW